MATLEPAYFERKLTGYRYVETIYGDTLPKVAARELGNAERWTELAWINNLIPPYITDDQDLANPRVLRSGEMLLVPAPSALTPLGEPDVKRIFDADCRLTNRLLEAENGDFSVVSGRENFSQQLIHRVVTERGDMLWHPRYGCLVRRLIGRANGPAASILASQYVKATLEQDLRVRRVVRVSATIQPGDTLIVEVEVEPIAGRAVQFTLVLN